MKTRRIDLLVWILAIFYCAFSFFSLFSRTPRKVNSYKKNDDREEWVEVPMMT